jgi:NADPH:quinone reductase-like Zn-dependent oxidoreductase
MRAVVFDTFGGPEVLHLADLPEPVAGKGEVLVKVTAATVNPTDTGMRGGRQAALMTDIKPPYIAGMEIAGHVHALGEGVTTLTVGQPVMGIVSPRSPGGGAYREYVALPAASVAVLAPDIDLVEAATVPMNGLTAKLSIEILGLGAGSRLLVTGGTGALGGYAIQLGKYFGLEVVADAHDADAELLRSLGASHVVPRGDGMADAVRALFPDGVDGLIDAALLADTAAALVRDGGAAVNARVNPRITDPRLRTATVGVLSQATNNAALVWLAEMVAKGALTPRVALRVPVAEAAEAHRRVEQGGLRGRAVLIF